MNPSLRVSLCSVWVAALLVGCGPSGKISLSSGTGGSAGATGGTSSGVVRNCDAGCGDGYACQSGSCVALGCQGVPEGQGCSLDSGVSAVCCGQACETNSAFDADSSNCGGCGRVCPTGTTCLDSSCVLDGGDYRCGSTTVCPSGMTCLEDACVFSDCAGAIDGAPCDSDSVLGDCCGGICRNVDIDSSNCGVCGIACGAGAFCNDGACVASPSCADAGGAVCPLSSTETGTCCGGACADLASDPNNCGGCGFGCPQGGICNGICYSADGGNILECNQAPDSGCAAGLICTQGGCVRQSCSGQPDGLDCGLASGALGSCCNSICADLAQDSANCGSCGRVCPTGSFCDGDTCTLFAGCKADGGATTSCPFSATQIGKCCGATCVDTSTDSSNCNACGVSCIEEASCAAAECRIDGGYVGCRTGTCPAGTLCVSTDYCLSASCTDRGDLTTCAIDANTSGSCCSASCVSLTADSNNCGRCGTICPAGTFCAEGECEPSPNCADAGAAFCPIDSAHTGRCCADGCVAESSDAANCGACGAECPVSGVCVAAECQLADGGGSLDCYEATCPAGTVCVDEVCLRSTCATTADGVGCALPNGRSGACCAQACVNLSQNADNCGTCGTVCGPGQLCEGSCVAFSGCTLDGGPKTCPASRTVNGVCCGSTCADLSADPLNCEACGRGCVVGASCVAEECEIDGGSVGCGSLSCPSGYDCVENAYCLQSSCSHSVDSTTCAFSSTEPGACCGGTCANEERDPSNCGECGQICGSGMFCSAGACEPTPDCTTASGQTCPIDSSHTGVCCEGSCVDFSSDSLDCGGCGYVCGAAAPCAAGSCSVSCQTAACPSGTSCAGSACATTSCAGIQDGPVCALSGQSTGQCCGQACLDTEFDSDNCGSCGKACATGSYCYYGSCEPFAGCTADGGSITCPLGRSTLGRCCGASCVAVGTSDVNCGACGQACAIGASCSKGICEVDGGEVSCDATDCPVGDLCVNGEICAATSCAGLPDSTVCAAGTNRSGICCAGVCIDPEQDSANCSQCGTACKAGTFCRYESCQPVPDCADAGSSVCPLDAHHTGTCCGSSCLDETSDPESCGGCGYECPSGEVCSNSSCGLADGGGGYVPCTPGTCPSGTVCQGAVCLVSTCSGAGDGLVCLLSGRQGICCGQACVDPNANSGDCGSCGATCASGTFCNEGRCEVSLPCTADGGHPACPVSPTVRGACCGTTCTDFDSDPSNCGECGRVCSLAYSCIAGDCYADDAGVRGCSGDGGCPAGLSCVDGEWCANPDCSGRADGTDCFKSNAKDTFGTCCAGVCVDAAADSSNCGSCGTSCAVTEFCDYNNCASSPNCADAGRAECPVSRTDFGVCCNGACEDFNVSPVSCGGCGISCTTQATCVNESCQLAGAFDACADVGDPCPSGFGCTGNYCLRQTCAGTLDGVYCDLDAGFGLCCGQRCINYDADPSNCGSCGAICASGSCVDESCQ